MRNRVAGLVPDGAEQADLLPPSLCGNTVAEREPGRVVAIEGTKQTGFRAHRFRTPVVQDVDHARQPERVGQQDELLSERRAGLPDFGEELDAEQPLLGLERHVPREGV